MKLFLSLAIILSALIAITSRGSLAALDNAGNYGGSNPAWPGTSGTTTGGSGFSAWTYNNANTGGEFLGANRSDSKVNSSGGNAWGVYANSGNNSQGLATRSFTGGSLNNGDAISLNWNNGQFVGNASGATSGSVGVALQNSGSTLIYYHFDYGTSSYQITVGAASFSTGLNFNQNAQSIVFTMGAFVTGHGYDWSLNVVGNDGSAHNLTYTGSGTSDYLSANTINDVQVFSYGNNSDIFFNNLQVTPVPEPITLALPIFGGLVLTTGLVRRFISRKAASVA